MAPRKNYKKKAPRRKLAPRRKMNKMNVTEQASLSCSRTLVELPGNAMRVLTNFTLADFPRAVNVARSYQMYRITGVKVMWRPNFDAYSSSGGALQQKPFLYHMIDKGAAIPTGINLEGLKQMGAKPRALDEKVLTTMFKPAVLQDSQNLIGSVASAYKVSPWLITNSNPDAALWNPSQVQHNGLYYYVECPGAVQTIRLEVELQFQFKKPLIDISPGPPATPHEYAVLDASPDGIEGGTDGITIPIVKTYFLNPIV